MVKRFICISMSAEQPTQLVADRAAPSEQPETRAVGQRIAEFLDTHQEDVQAVEAIKSLTLAVYESEFLEQSRKNDAATENQVLSLNATNLAVMDLMLNRGPSFRSKFWEAADDLIAMTAPSRVERLPIMRAHIASTVAVAEALQCGGHEVSFPTPYEDSFEAIDLWVGDTALQLKTYKYGKVMAGGLTWAEKVIAKPQTPEAVRVRLGSATKSIRRTRQRANRKDTPFMVVLAPRGAVNEATCRLTKWEADRLLSQIAQTLRTPKQTPAPSPQDEPGGTLPENFFAAESDFTPMSAPPTYAEMLRRAAARKQS